MKLTIGTKPFAHCETTIKCTEPVSDLRLTTLSGFFTLTISTGASSLQTYATRDDLMKLAYGLIDLAGSGNLKEKAA